MSEQAMTPEQREQIGALRDRWFRIATSTERCDRPRAEAAVTAACASGGVTIGEVEWVESPAAGAEAYQRRLGAQVASLSASLSASFSDSLSDILSASFWASLTPRLVGAALEISRGMFLLATLSIISDETRPLVMSKRPAVGMLFNRHSPKTLSMALCRPMSSLKTRMFSVSARAALCTPPVSLNS